MDQSPLTTYQIASLTKFHTNEKEKIKKIIKPIPVPMCWEGFVGCMAPWQTFCWTLLCEWIRPVCVKNWLREEQRSANWTWSKDQFLRSACLILSIKPIRKALEILVSIICSANTARKIVSHNFFSPLKISTGSDLPCNEKWHLKIIQSLITSKCGQTSFRTLISEPLVHQLTERLNHEFCSVSKCTTNCSRNTIKGDTYFSYKENCTYERKQDHVFLVVCQKKTHTHLGTVKGLHLTN